MVSRQLIHRLQEGYYISLMELTQLIESVASDPSYLFQQADQVRSIYSGEEIHLRAIIEFSNYCRCRCRYCGLNSQNMALPRYRMSPEEIIDCALEAYQAGYKTIVLQSGEDPWYTKDMIAHIVKEIKSLGDVAVTLSLGERDIDEYFLWKKAGADRYLLKHETADEELYNLLHPHSSFASRIRCLKDLKSLGYQVGSGFIIGLPGQTTATIAKDVLLLQELEVGMAGIGPFIPHPQTPLGHLPPGDLKLTLIAVALTRLVMKNINLPATTAFGTIADEQVSQDERAPTTHISPFSCGANVLMKKVEPHHYRSLYDIYPKKLGKPKSIPEERKEAETMITSLNRQIALDRGDCFGNYRSIGRQEND